jgi:hypothetical protein
MLEVVIFIIRPRWVQNKIETRDLDGNENKISEKEAAS